VAKQDVSLARLETLLNEGYVNVTWQKSASPDEVCRLLHGQRWKLAEFISGLEHEAPIFEVSHVNCRCTVVVRHANRRMPPMRVKAWYFV